MALCLSPLQAKWKPYVSTQAGVIRSALWCVSNYRWERMNSAETQAKDRGEKHWATKRMNTLHRRNPFTTNDHTDRFYYTAIMWHTGCCVLSNSTWLCELRIQSHHFKEVLQNLLRGPRHYLVSGATENKRHPSLIKKHWHLMLNDTAMALHWFVLNLNACLWLLHLITTLLLQS